MHKRSPFLRLLMMSCLAVLALCVIPVLPTALKAKPAYALANGLALTPPMGWSTWYTYACNINEQEVEAQADAMVSSGMLAAGYQYINIDDCWQGGRDSNGNVYPDPTKFPDGMKAVADYVHSKGLKLGIYTDRGTNTCGGYVGSQGHEVQDADTYASWGIDFVKDDNCNASLNEQTQYETMRDALAQSGRPMVFNLSSFTGGAASYGPNTANMWRTGSDVASWNGNNLPVYWSSILTNIDNNAQYPEVNGPGSWNDPDNLMIGKNLSTTEDQSIFSMWSIMAAPLVFGSDMTTMSSTTKNLITNPEVIAVDQDPLGIQGSVVSQDSSGNLQVWAKQLQASGTWAVALFNRGDTAANITANWSSIGLTGSPDVRDLWARSDLGSYANSYTANVPAHGTVLLKVSGTPNATPSTGTSYLSDLNPTFATAGWGTVQRDKSITGAPITLHGTVYSKGIGTHAVSDIRYNLGGNCSAFVSDIGIDDDVSGNSTASVIFRVYADSVKIYDSGTMGASSPTQTVNVNVSGAQTLRLIVSDNYDGINYDHGDWAGARITCGTGTTAIPQSQMSATASSYHPGYEPGNVLDGDGNTMWHDEWTPFTPLPQSITLNLGGTYNVAMLRYLPRNGNDGSTNGRITAYNVYTSLDGTNFTLVSSGNWSADGNEKYATFPATSASYVRLEALAGVNNFASAAEINIEHT